jgi:hypothetical protein
MLTKLNYGEIILKGPQIIVCTRAPQNLVAAMVVYPFFNHIKEYDVG